MRIIWKPQLHDISEPMKLPEIADCDRILIYCSMGREVDTRRIIDAMFASRKDQLPCRSVRKGHYALSELRPGGLKVSVRYIRAGKGFAGNNFGTRVI